jgi:hypothetical protein
MSQTSTLPVVFNDEGESEDRAIRGSILKCVDGRWAVSQDDTPAPTGKLLALGVRTSLVHWSGGKVLEEIVKKPGEPLPDVDALNAKIPASEWEDGLNNEPRPPWSKVWSVYLVDPQTADRFTFRNATTGAMRAVTELRERVDTMAMMHGKDVLPFVKLANRAMKTRFGTKVRPHFQIVGWQGLGDNVVPLESGANKYLEVKGRASVASGAPLDDEIPFAPEWR